MRASGSGAAAVRGSEARRAARWAHSQCTLAVIIARIRVVGSGRPAFIHNPNLEALRN